MDGIEIEWQFEVKDLEPLRAWLAARGRRHRSNSTFGVTFMRRGTVTDTYFDTEDWRIYRAGFALRHRVVEGEADRLTMKELLPPMEGLSRRREIEEPGSPPIGAGAGEVGRRARGYAGRRPFRPLFALTQDRAVYHLVARGSPIAEISLDQTEINPPRGSVLQRVELEILPGTALAQAQSLARCRRFIQTMRRVVELRPSSIPKFRAGLEAGGLAPERWPDLGRSPETRSLRGLAAVALQAQVRALVREEPETRLGDDPEALHRMRVATRRLRAALVFFREVLPEEAGPLRARLGRLGRALGTVRDLDVQEERLESWQRRAGSLSPLRDPRAWAACARVLARDKRAARAALVRQLDSPQHEALVRDLSALVRGTTRRPSRAADVQHRLAPGLLERRRKFDRAMRALDPSAPAERFHALRILGKRLRYALEFARPVLGQGVERYLRRLVRMQDLLGRMQDAVVAGQRLRSSRGPSTREGLLLAGALRDRYAEIEADARADFPRAARRLTGRVWRELRARIEGQSGGTR